jgi:hypothetical protein
MYIHIMKVLVLSTIIDSHCSILVAVNFVEENENECYRKIFEILVTRFSKNLQHTPRNVLLAISQLEDYENDYIKCCKCDEDNDKDEDLNFCKSCEVLLCDNHSKTHSITHSLVSWDMFLEHESLITFNLACASLIDYLHLHKGTNSFEIQLIDVV